MKYNRDWLYNLKINDDTKIIDIMTDKEKYGDFISSVTELFINNINLPNNDNVDDVIASIIKSSLYLTLTSKFLADITQYKLEEMISDRSFIQQFVSDAYDIIDKDLAERGLFLETTSD